MINSTLYVKNTGPENIYGPCRYLTSIGIPNIKSRPSYLYNGNLRTWKDSLYIETPPPQKKRKKKKISNDIHGASSVFCGNSIFPYPSGLRDEHPMPITIKPIYTGKYFIWNNAQQSRVYFFLVHTVGEASSTILSGQIFCDAGVDNTDCTRLDEFIDWNFLSICTCV